MLGNSIDNFPELEFYFTTERDIIYLDPIEDEKND